MLNRDIVKKTGSVFLANILQYFLNCQSTVSNITLTYCHVMNSLCFMPLDAYAHLFQFCFIMSFFFYKGNEWGLLLKFIKI